MFKINSAANGCDGEENQSTGIFDGAKIIYLPDLMFYPPSATLVL